MGICHSTTKLTKTAYPVAALPSFAVLSRNYPFIILSFMNIGSYNKALAQQLKKALEFAFLKEMDPAD